MGGTPAALAALPMSANLTSLSSASTDDLLGLWSLLFNCLRVLVLRVLAVTLAAEHCEQGDLAMHICKDSKSPDCS